MKKSIVTYKLLFLCGIALSAHSQSFTNISSTFDKIGTRIKGLGEDIKKTGEKALDAVSSVTNTISNSTKNILFGEPKPVFCPPISGVTYTPTIKDPEIIKQDTEKRIATVEKYSPIIYLCNERYFPNAVEDYFLAPETQLVYQPNHKKNPLAPRTIVIPKGKVTMEKIYENSTKYSGEDYFFEIGKCTEFGSDPARFTDAQGNLTVPIYATWTETSDKIYIVYAFMYGFNGAYPINIPAIDVPLLKGDVTAIQGAHEGDKEHITLELDKKTRTLERIFFAAHRTREGIWLPANHPDIKYEGTHPIIHSATNGHGSYPREGTHVRIFGFGNDITCKKHKWVPQVVLIYPDTDPRFNPKTMGWAYHSGDYGPRGVGSMRIFFDGSFDDGKGQPYEKSYFCPNPKSANDVKGWLQYNACLTEKRFKAVVP